MSKSKRVKDLEADFEKQKEGYEKQRQDQPANSAEIDAHIQKATEEFEHKKSLLENDGQDIEEPEAETGSE